MEQHHSMKEELLCHFPYAMFSVALSMIVLSLLTMNNNVKVLHQLFHNFHFLHLLFAGSGTVLIFRKYSQNVLLGGLVGFFVPVVFCTLSDAILPYYGGRFLGLNMHLHWCFWEHLDKVLPFLLVGIINGFVAATHHVSKQIFYSAWSHFAHIFVSSMASMLYLVSFGFSDWHSQIGLVFLFLLFAVLVPCTLSDVVVPMTVAKAKHAHSKAS